MTILFPPFLTAIKFRTSVSEATPQGFLQILSVSDLTVLVLVLWPLSFASYSLCTCVFNLFSRLLFIFKCWILVNYSHKPEVLTIQVTMYPYIPHIIPISHTLTTLSWNWDDSICSVDNRILWLKRNHGLTTWKFNMVKLVKLNGHSPSVWN